MSEKKSKLIAAIIFYVIALVLGVMYGAHLQGDFMMLLIGCFGGAAAVKFSDYLYLIKEEKKELREIL